MLCLIRGEFQLFQLKYQDYFVYHIIVKILQIK